MREKLDQRLEMVEKEYFEEKKRVLKVRDDELLKIQNVSEEIMKDREEFLNLTHKFEKRLSLMNNNDENACV